MRVFLLAVLILLPAAARAALVTVTLSGAAHGMLKLAVFADAASFKAQARPMVTRDLTPENGGADVTLDLPPGTYAAAVYQDTNGNGRLDTSWLGIPKEPYGFSGMPARYGAPDFARAAFTVPAPGPILIRLQTF